MTNQEANAYMLDTLIEDLVYPSHKQAEYMCFTIAMAHQKLLTLWAATY